jgi:hypothetical protein
MKTKNLLLALGSIFLFSLGCTNEIGNEQPIPGSTLKNQSDLDETSNEQPNSDESDTNRSLQDTNWKLAGIVDSETNTLKELKPDDCDRCYTLHFDTDSTLTGRSSVNDLFANYEIDFDLSSIQIKLARTKIYEPVDGELYVERLMAIQSFSVTDKELKLYYGEQGNYLLYKPWSEGTNGCAWETVNPVPVSDIFKQELDHVFSENNEIVKNIEGDTLLFVINNEQELKEIGYIGGLSSQAVDFANETVVWGKILTSSISDKIFDKQLSVCSSVNNYKYDVTIEKCTNCWFALGYLYFWEIYPVKINAEDILLIIN